MKIYEDICSKGYSETWCHRGTPANPLLKRNGIKNKQNKNRLCEKWCRNNFQEILFSGIVSVQSSERPTNWEIALNYSSSWNRVVSPDLSWLQFSIIPKENFSAASVAVLCYMMRAEKLCCLEEKWTCIFLSLFHRLIFLVSPLDLLDCMAMKDVYLWMTKAPWGIASWMLYIIKKCQLCLYVYIPRPCDKLSTETCHGPSQVLDLIWFIFGSIKCLNLYFGFVCKTFTHSSQPFWANH